MRHPLVLLLVLLSGLPLGWLRGLGATLGWLLHAVAGGRRRVVRTNLELCFPGLPPERRRKIERAVFVRFAQSWLDRGWLWHGSPERVRARLRVVGALDALEGQEPVVLFAPHFMGLDAGWTALNLMLPRRFVTIFTGQESEAIDAWVLRGRERFGQPRLFRRADGVQPVVRALREGRPLYLLPDMNFGPEESIFVPFYGVSAATVPSLSRFARLGRARVVPVVSRMTPDGYDVQLLPPWSDFPGDDVQADTALMNARLQQWIDSMPDQYYWVHKRFKTRPAGEPPVYG